MSCDIIIPIWNQVSCTRDCLEHILKNTKSSYRLILIDNASDEETKEYLRRFACGHADKTMLIRNEENLGFVKAVNQGMKASSAPYVCIMNNDTIPASGWLENMIEFAEKHPDVGLANPQCDGHGDSDIEVHARKLAENRDSYMEMNQCFGYCMLVKREVINKIGYLDEAFGMGNYDDTDYSMRVGRAGYRCVNVHSSYVYHKKHVSFKAMGGMDSLVSKGAIEYFKKWPRHLRIGLSVHMGESVSDKEVESLLHNLLWLAREWCWINLWIFGEKDNSQARIKKVSRDINMPLHQNIKFNYLPKMFGTVQSAVRLIERSFGTKKRKKYDAVLVDNDSALRILKALYPLHKTKILRMRSGSEAFVELSSLLSDLRG